MAGSKHATYYADNTILRIELEFAGALWHQRFDKVLEDLRDAFTLVQRCCIGASIILAGVIPTACVILVVVLIGDLSELRRLELRGLLELERPRIVLGAIMIEQGGYNEVIEVVAEPFGDMDEQ